MHIELPAFVAVVGANGSGKTTLLKILAGLLPYQGLITHPFHRMAYLPQSSLLNKNFPLRVFDTVAMGLFPDLGLFKVMTKQQGRLVQQAISDVGLQAFSDAPLSTLSGGQFQRVLFARLMLQRADFILLDEPFAAVDETTTHFLLEMLQKWHQQGKTIFVVLHQQDLVKNFFPYCLTVNEQHLLLRKFVK